MALELSKSTVLSTDKKYLFLENSYNESGGNASIKNLFLGYYDEGLQYDLGFDTDQRFPLVPSKLLTFNETETETEE